VLIRSKTFHKFFIKDSFTLIEILLVVILLGVIAGLVIPNFSNTYTRVQLKEAANNLSFLMQYAQNQAIVKKCNFQLIFDDERSKYWIVKQVDDEELNNSDLEYRRISSRFGRMVNIAPQINVETELDHITFYPDGMIQKARVYLSDNKDRYFTVSTKEQTGYVQVFDFKAE